MHRPPGTGRDQRPYRADRGGKSRTPLLLVAAEATSRQSNFYIDDVALASVAGAVHRRIADPETAVADVVAAAQTAVGERRTVVVSLPLDVQAADCPWPGELKPLTRPGPIAPPSNEIEAVASSLRSASKPLLIAGRGAVLADARTSLETLAEKTGALLATSAVAYGLSRAIPGTSASAVGSPRRWVQS